MNIPSNLLSLLGPASSRVAAVLILTTTDEVVTIVGSQPANTAPFENYPCATYERLHSIHLSIHDFFSTPSLYVINS